jgi:hypothetical protein
VLHLQSIPQRNQLDHADQLALEWIEFIATCLTGHRVNGHLSVEEGHDRRESVIPKRILIDSLHPAFCVTPPARVVPLVSIRRSNPLELLFRQRRRDVAKKSLLDPQPDTVIGQPGIDECFSESQRICRIQRDDLIQRIKQRGVMIKFV